MYLPVVQQREVTRPRSAQVPMPDLQVPEFGLPDVTHRGTSLAQLGDLPAADSARAVRDMSITRGLVAQRTPAGDAWARDMDLHGTTAIWQELATQVRGDQAVAQALLGKALAAASVQGGLLKRKWSRPRPFQQDPSITVIGRTPKHVDSSYPSIHSARAFAAARILSSFDPGVTDAAYALAREVAVSRVYAGVHFVSDAVAGARLGTHLAESVLRRWREGKLELELAPEASTSLVA